MKRRGFIGGIAAVVAGGRQAADVAAKEVMGVAAQASTGLGFVGAGGTPYAKLEPTPYPEGNASVFAANNDDAWETATIRRSEFLRKTRPSWWIDQHRQHTAITNVHYIDSDIAALRSLSPVAKCRMQSERNLERRLIEDEVYARRNREQRIWHATVGKVAGLF